MSASDDVLNMDENDDLISVNVDVGSGNFAKLSEEIFYANNISLTGDITRDSQDDDIIIREGKYVTINGNGHAINANKLGRAFVVLPNSGLTLINVKLINGDAYKASYAVTNDGGSIINMGNLNIINCNFTNNNARDGGAIACDIKATTNITGTIFTKNIAQQDGGAISNMGGSTMYISGKNTFDSNTAVNRDGKGGAILNAFQTTLVMSGEATFTSNKAFLDGGAIFNHQAKFNLTGVNIFTKNEANGGDGKGGAVNNENGTFYLGGTNTFTSNYANRGGAIDNNLFESEFTMTGTNTFTNNRAGNMGGAIANQEARKFTMGGVNTFTSNSASIGGAFFSYDTTIAINARNTFTKNSAGQSGGAMYLSKSGSVIQGSNNFTSNTAPNDGGAIILLDTNRIELKGENIFSSNSASSTGGAIRANNVNNLILSNHNYFTNNKVSNNGGTIYLLNSALNSQGSLFEGGSAVYGGAIFLENSRLTANYNIFKNNQASGTGADIELYSGGINSLEYNYWNSQSKVAQSKIHNYNVGNINTWAVLDITVPSEIKQDSEVEVVRFKSNSLTALGGEMPNYAVSVTPGFSPANVFVSKNVGKSSYTGNPGQITVTVTSSNFKASKTVNAVTGILKTYLNGNNIILRESTQSAVYEVVLSDEKGNKLSGQSISVKVDDTSYSKTTDSSGKVTLSLSNLSNGYHNIFTTFNGNAKYYASNTTNGIICLFSNQSSAKITAGNVEMYYKDGSRYEVTLTDANNRPLASKEVKIYINGNIYSRTTDSNGKASIALNLNAGEFNVIGIYPDKDFAYTENTVTIKSTVMGANITKYFRNQTQYYATFLDKNGGALKNTEVKFNINGVIYNRVSDENGVAHMNINLNPQTYIITATNPVNGEMHSNTITVLGILEGADLTKYYRNESKFSVKVLDEKGSPVKAGVSVTLNINGVFYTRATNASGYANMNINLAPGTYTVTTEYNSYKTSNTIKVLPTLKASDLTKKYGTASPFKVEVLDGQGKTVANASVRFNINGVFYTRVSNESGIASLNINLMPAQYVITSTYNGLNIANKVTITS